MLQDDMLDNRNITTTPPTIQTNFEETLSFDPETGTFTFGSKTLDSAGVFRIPLSTPQTIVINAGSGIEFSTPPFKTLPLNNSGDFNAPSPFTLISSTQIEIDVTDLPSATGVLGFVLIVELTNGPITIQRLQTPPFLVTLDQEFPEPDLSLQYNPTTGVFTLAENGTPSPGSITLEKGLVILRLHDGGNTPSSDINVSLVSEGIIFAHPAVLFNPDSGATLTRHSDTEITITRDFTPGTGFCVSFGLQLSGEPDKTVVYSPDPIIVDKTVGTNPDPGS